jgi:putative PIN family toxin of toxin-antitoxin system
VLDTNVVLDLFVFFDPRSHGIAAASLSPSWTWIASESMRSELERVLTYANITTRLTSFGTTAAHVLAQYDARIRLMAAAPRSSAVCKDPDDQIFIDLAVQHRAVLISKDKAVLALKKKLTVLGVHALSAHEFAG